MRVLALNAGSSSLKFALFEVDTSERRLASGAIEHLDGDDTRLTLRDGDGRTLETRPLAARAGRAAVEAALDAIAPPRLPPPQAVGHRLVHGGPQHVRPERVDARLLRDLERLVAFAPLHLPVELAAIRAVADRAPQLPQVVCFDTAFHRRMPERAQRLPLPRALWDAGIRRYGFHGLSYEYVLAALGSQARGRLVVAHLGSGASMAAIRDGIPVETTMSLTPTGGLVMSTRSGDLDPGILIHLLRTRGWDADRLEQLVSRESGLLGVSARSGDMATLLAARATDPRAAEAVAMFCDSARAHIGGLAATLGGLDTLVFTGGIGERADAVRAEICEGLEFLGIDLDAARNACHADVISRADGACVVRVIATDEDRVVARHVAAALTG